MQTIQLLADSAVTADRDTMKFEFPYESPSIQPPLQEWPVAVHALHNSELAELRISARNNLAAAAQKYQSALSALAGDAGLSAGSFPEYSSPDLPLILTGHQPIVFHPGLVCKYQLTQQFAIRNQAYGAAVCIDSDFGDAGAFCSPAVPAADTTDCQQIEQRNVSWSTKPSLLLNSRLISATARQSLAASVQADLLKCNCAESAAAFGQFAERLQNLPEGAAAPAMTLLRQSAGIGNALAEVPLTELCRLPEAIRFFAAVLRRAPDFHSVYNQTMQDFRSQQDIRNPANPFPDLQSDDEGFELPFWMIQVSADSRLPLWLRRRNSEQWLCCGPERICSLSPGHEAEALMACLLSGYLAVPRGALITAFLRLLFCDLFVHGLGGGRYDPATDQLIRNWWQEDPPPFAAVSGSRYLFPEQRHRLAEEQQLLAGLRELQQHPEHYLNSGYFDEQTCARLQQLISQKQLALRELQQNRELGQPSRDVGQKLQSLGQELRNTVSSALQPRLAFSSMLTTESLAALQSRLWPWFFFSDHQQAFASEFTL